MTQQDRDFAHRLTKGELGYAARRAEADRRFSLAAELWDICASKYRGATRSTRFMEARRHAHICRWSAYEYGDCLL